MKFKDEMYLRKTIFILTMLITGSISGLKAQNVGIKTNLVDDALLNINLGVEIGLAPKWTIDVPASFNDWTLDEGKRWKHWWVQPGARYWFCDRFGGHFIGIHAHGGQFNVGGFDGKINFLGTNFQNLKDHRYQGWFIGGGVSYGYAWVLGKHWNLEAEIGIGYAYSRYDRYRCAGCGKKDEENRPHNYYGITKAALNFVYLF